MRGGTISWAPGEARPVVSPGCDNPEAAVSNGWSTSETVQNCSGLTHWSGLTRHMIETHERDHGLDTKKNWRVLALAALPALACGADGVAAADLPEGLQLFLTSEVVHDSNLFRLPDSDPLSFQLATGSRSDTITRLGASLRYDKIISLQHVIAEIGVQQNSFQHNDEFDHTASNAAAKWLWQSGSQWDGELSYGFTRRLTSFADLRLKVRNMVDLQTAVATAGYKLDSRWRIWGGVNGLQTDNSSPTQIHNDTDVLAGLAGFDYRTPSDNSIGVLVKQSEGRFPHREIVAAQLIDNRYSDTSPALVWAWNLTEQSHFDGRFGYTVRKQDQFSARDFRGPTFQIHYTGLPTGKVRVDANTWRELWTAESQTSSYVVASGVRLTPTWFVTSKVSLRGALAYETRSYEGDPGVALGATLVRDDTLRTLQLGLSYAVLRNSEISLMLERGTRDSNQPEFNYDYNSVLVNLKLGF